MYGLILRYLPWLPIGFIVIDIISGLLLHTTGSSLGISVLYKFTVILLCLLLLSLGRTGGAQLSFLTVFITVVYGWLYSLVYGNQHIAYQVTEIFKLFSLFIIAFGLIECYKIKPFDLKAINLFFLITVSVFAINILLGLFGIGFKAYSTHGIKGFFYSGNSLSGIITILSVYVLTKANKINWKAYIVTFVFFMILALLIGTKSAILAVGIVGVAIPFRSINLRTVITIGLVSLVSLLPLLAFSGSILNSAFISRLVFMYNQGGIANLILSGRNEFLATLLPSYFENLNSAILLGLDRGISATLVHNITEMDLSDMLIFMGLPISLIYLFCFGLLFKYLKDNLTKDIFFEVSLTSFVLVLIGLISGHVLFNGVITPYWAAVLAFGFIRSVGNNENRNFNNTISIG
ncbi:O-antigen ligase family protein [Photobacterium rosenbergii]|uniref:O-antigen ligase family protein n=1 Tax=Photobacterium rosenbergii TaxID=294936 RepID=A0ABU3ZPT4_9GAMM|nr:O-antigen ligase family protein [Photobacterium rosenbergii]MDV5172115.1 O-antigen ligase family protein [Photobacterium rosenbergii]